MNEKQELVVQYMEELISYGVDHDTEASWNLIKYYVLDALDYEDD